MRDVVAVVEGDLLPFSDIAQGIQVQAILFIDEFAVRIAGMIGQARVIIRFVAIEVVRLVQLKNVDGGPPGAKGVLVKSQPAAIRLLFGDAFAHIFDQARSFADETAGKEALTVNPGAPDLKEGVDPFGLDRFARYEHDGFDKGKSGRGSANQNPALAPVFF